MTDQELRALSHDEAFAPDEEGEGGGGAGGGLEVEHAPAAKAAAPVVEDAEDAEEAALVGEVRAIIERALLFLGT
jgi:hypothetical protein